MNIMESTITAGFAPEDLNQTRKCSRCRSELVESFFDRNRKGELKKCCKNCTRSKKINNVSKNLEGLTDYGKTVINSLDEEKIEQAREMFIQQTICMSAGRFVHVGMLNKSDTDYPNDQMPNLRGDEVLIEYHLFRDQLSPLQVVNRWRARFDRSLMIQQ